MHVIYICTYVGEELATHFSASCAAQLLLTHYDCFISSSREKLRQDLRSLCAPLFSFTFAG